MELIDNINKTLKGDFVTELRSGSKVGIAASYFSIYAFSDNVPNPYTKYSYANGSYTGEMDSTKLNQILQDIVNNIDIYTPQLVTTTTNINTDPAKVELVKLDTNKNIIIKLDNVANPEAGSTVAELITAGVVEHDTTNNKYYINLNDDYFASAKTIDITYYETKPVSNT